MKINCWCGKPAKGKIRETKSELYGESLKYSECKNCGTFRQTNEVDLEQRNRVYAEEIAKRISREFQEPLEKQVQNFWGKLDAYAWGIMSSGTEKNLLDVGCSTGTFLNHAKKFGNKFTLFGQDINKEALAKVTATANLKADSLENCRYPNDFFDIITCHDVIEHVFNPFLYLMTIFRILKPGGCVQITTPNSDFQSIQKWEMARPDHLWLFSSLSIRRILIESGFDANKIVIEDISRFSYDGAMMVVVRK